MTETRNRPPLAPVVELLMGLKQLARPAKQDRNRKTTGEAFERDRIGVAAKE